MRLLRTIHRHRIHKFRPVYTDKIKIEIASTNGASTARIYEIRAYKEG